MEAENDRRSEALRNKVSTLRNIAVDIRDDVDNQNQYISDNSNLFETATALMKGSFGRVQQMNKQTSQNCKIMCYFILFAIIVFFIGYLLIGRLT